MTELNSTENFEQAYNSLKTAYNKILEYSVVSDRHKEEMDEAIEELQDAIEDQKEQNTSEEDEE